MCVSEEGIGESDCIVSSLVIAYTELVSPPIKLELQNPILKNGTIRLLDMAPAFKNSLSFCVLIKDDDDVTIFRENVDGDLHLPSFRL